MYISNLVSQPGETDGYTVRDHVDALNYYLGDRSVDVVIANEGQVSMEVTDVYREKEQKTVIKLDRQEIEMEDIEVIAGDIIRIEDGSIRHDELKTAYLVFSYLMR